MAADDPSPRDTITSFPSPGLCLDLELIPTGDDQKASLGARMLHGLMHHGIEQLFDHYLTRNGLRDLVYCREIESFDRRRDGRRRTQQWQVQLKTRIQAVELLHFSFRAPCCVAGASVTQV